VITRDGEVTGVILPLNEYDALLERAADAEDARWLKERRKRSAARGAPQEERRKRSAARGAPQEERRKRSAARSQ
jgi:hypothetical protein